MVPPRAGVVTADVRAVSPVPESPQLQVTAAVAMIASHLRTDDALIVGSSRRRDDVMRDFIPN